jgi:hypothetical protein
MARAAGAFTTLPVALVFNAVSESMAGHFREAGTRRALMLEVLTMSSGPAGDTENLGQEQERDHARRQLISHD